MEARAHHTARAKTPLGAMAIGFICPCCGDSAERPELKPSAASGASTLEQGEALFMCPPSPLPHPESHCPFIF